MLEDRQWRPRSTWPTTEFPRNAKGAQVSAWKHSAGRCGRLSIATAGRLLEEITEVESGKRSDRPELRRAIRRAKVSGARLIIAKLDRLSRNASFLLHLRDSVVRFIAADLPNADETVVGIMAVIAQREREVIAQRTKESLAVARKRLVKEGRTLGNPLGLGRKGGSRNRRLAAHEAGAIRRSTQSQMLKAVFFPSS